MSSAVAPRVAGGAAPGANRGGYSNLYVTIRGVRSGNTRTDHSGLDFCYRRPSAALKTVTK